MIHLDHRRRISAKHGPRVACRVCGEIANVAMGRKRTLALRLLILRDQRSLDREVEIGQLAVMSQIGRQATVCCLVLEKDNGR